MKKAIRFALALLFLPGLLIAMTITLIGETILSDTNYRYWYEFWRDNTSWYRWE